MKTITSQRTVAFGLLGIFAATTFGGAAVHTAQAQSKKTWRNLAIAGGVATGYGLLKKKKGVAIVGGVGTAYAYSRYRSKKKQEDRRRANWYQRRYGRNWRAHYRG
jgi:hypothetical protein